MNRFMSFIMVFILPLALFAQGTVSGTVTDAASGAALAGANVVVEGTSMGAAADADGSFTIKNIPTGNYTITASMIGYSSASQTVNVRGSITVNFTLQASALELSALEVLAWRATRETPVAYTNVEKKDMELRLGSRDIPLVLNTTPSVYATVQGGGAGDARVNVRGFNQRNVAIMINGVPVNDMENAWVYWSNWDGVGDATSSIQVQRGLSAVNLATPSIGGTMNIITDPAAQKWGGLIKQEIGSWGFLKSTASFNTGLINDKLALSGTVVRKTGDGYYGATWTDAWAYYFGASYALSNKDRFEFYALGAPQRHGQNLYKQNIAVYNRKFAEDLDDYDKTDVKGDKDEDGNDIPNGIPDSFDKFNETGRDFNQNYSNLDTDSKQYWALYREHNNVDRFDKGFLNSRENFFHKPQVNFNWYHTFNDRMRLSSVLYWSGGHGGGTGTYGALYRQDANGNLGDDDYKFYYGPSPWTWDWDATIAMNSAAADTYYVDKKQYIKEDGQSVGILRNSRNNQWTIGAISKLHYDLSDEIKIITGIDWRTAEIDHFREVRDLLGGEYFEYTGNDFDTTPESQKKRLGDKIAYYFTNTVDWIGLFGQGEYVSGPLSAYGMLAYSTINYNYTNHFKDDGSGKELKIESGTIGGYQLKGGAKYALSDGLRIFGNLGLVSKVPIFDFVIDDRTGIKNEDYENEEFLSYEAGVDFSSRSYTIKANAYFTSWKNRTFKEEEFELETEEEVLVFLTGVNANHSGVEIEAAYQPMSLFRLDAAASFGNWVFTDDAKGDFRIADTDSSVAATFYIKDLKVGDAPQRQIALSASLYPMPGTMAQVVFRSYGNNYSDFNPFTRTNSDDRKQSWQVPDYNVLDFHASYNLPVDFGGVKLQVLLHVFNLLDTEYIQDATDNSQFNAWDKDHDADDAEVFFGLPRQINVGLNVRF